MTSDFNSRSMDSRPSDFNDGAEEILMNTSFEIEAPGQNEGDDRSGCTTPESHKDSCHGYGAFGQGAPIIRDKYPEPSPPDLEQTSDSSNDNPGNINVLSPKRKIRDEDDTLRSVFQDITNVQVASVPAIELLPLKRRKFGKQSELFEGGLVRFLAKVVQEIAIA
ncbi:hypothetical protein BD769DRAFT_1395571 [Suillus cothurnatus]|nr:hypothetical protein BD769DRAFT_1395571 [Suillus cothurnatus]